MHLQNSAMNCPGLLALASAVALLLEVRAAAPPPLEPALGKARLGDAGGVEACSGFEKTAVTCYGAMELPSGGPFHDVTILYVSASNLQWISINAFQSFPNLEDLSVGYSKVEFVDEDAFRGLDSLRFIHLQGNSIKTLRSVSIPETVELLDISNNPLDFSGASPFPESAPNITTLFASNVGLANIADSHLQSMESLDRLRIMRNSLTSLNLQDFLGLEHLSSIDVEFNAVTQVVGLSAGEELPSVTFLDIGHNQIRSIDATAFQGLPALQELRLHDNPLTVPLNAAMLSHSSLTRIVLSRANAAAVSSKTFEALPKLTSVELIEGRVSDISGAFTALLSLKTLNLRNNSLESVSANAFAPTGTLENLILSSNPLQQLDSAALDNVMGRGGAIDISNTPLACSKDKVGLVTWAFSHGVSLNAPCPWNEVTDCTSNEDCKVGYQCVNGQCDGGVTVRALPLAAILLLALTTSWKGAISLR